MDKSHLRRHSCRFLATISVFSRRRDSARDAAPVILSQSNPVYDHRDDLPHYIRTQLQSRIRKPAQNLEPDAKRFRLDAGKRAVLMLSHDVDDLQIL